MIRGATVTAAVAAITLFGAAQALFAAPPSLYKGPVQRLLPSAAEVGYEQILSQSGSGSRVSATYGSSGTPGLTLAIRVFKTETAAISSFGAACPGCQLRTVPSGSWKYKFQFTVGTAGVNTVTAIARCRNLRVDTSRLTGSTNPHVLAGPSVRIIDAIFVKARRLGMSACAGKGAPPPTTGTYYWSESYAEQIVIAKVRIPRCNVYPDDPQCGTAAPFRVVDAQCRGLDEKPGTFTYSRFTCDIRAGYYGNITGRIAVWPTGPTTLRWNIL